MRISEVSKRFDLTPDTLRYYERIGLLPNVKRNESGNRDYGEEDCNWIEFIKCMRNAGISIEALIEYVDMFQQGNSTIQARKELLIEQRNELYQRIEEMKEVLKRLDNKIDGYEERVIVAEEELKIK
ncbi:MerR family transcriptional regulator [Orenia marismortui]|uniref:DNA-binding transcriptional MerR regulator n=1 Tax=Orenia marismortui TaxID=46469 RepID=A0A4R8H6M3_9FIRM|nr:MerR family transcriptional regulator [Orenia marismortui]TDX53226.1 DNA-binding transcriptional MerR regulator [Orenia marismortui]